MGAWHSVGLPASGRRTPSPHPPHQQTAAVFAFAFLFTILLFHLAYKVMSGLATSVGMEDPEPRIASQDASKKEQTEEVRQGRRNSIAASRRTSLV